MKLSFLIVVLLFGTACSSIPANDKVVDSSKTSNTLLIYEDGRMELNSRFVNEEDIVIYNDGRGGERAAIKVRVPIHSDFYRDSILVVRVGKKHDESIADESSVNLPTDAIN